MTEDIGLFEAIYTQPADGHRYGPTNRRRVEEVTFSETWAQRWDAGAATSGHE